jgi:hypothetical protein
VIFDLAPPTEEQLRELAADLDEQERRVLLEHGTEAPFCGIFLDEKRDGGSRAGCAVRVWPCGAWVGRTPAAYGIDKRCAVNRDQDHATSLRA